MQGHDNFASNRLPVLHMRSSYTCLTKKNLAMEAQRKSKRKRQPTRDLGRVEKAMAECKYML